MRRQRLIATAGLLAVLAWPALAQTPPETPAAAPPESAASAPPALAAPAAPTPATPTPEAPAPTPPPAAVAGEPEGHVPPPPANKGQVVFFRIGAYSGVAVWYKVRDNGQELGKLTNASWFVVPVDPGKHTFTAATENQTKLTLEIDPGETYYVRGTVHMGLLVGEPSLSPADAAMFEQHYKHMRQQPAGVSNTPTASPPAKPAA